MGFAQKKSEADTLPKSFLPTGVRLGTDAIALIRTQTDKSFSGYELNADVDFYRYYLAVDAGKWERTLSNDQDRYTNSGKYYRMGADVNFLTKDPEKNMFFFGMRYGWGSFSEKLSVTTIDPVWGTNTNTFANNHVKATWGELVTGLRVRMWKFFWMGYTARYKFGLNTNTPDGLTTHDVPGYGKTAKESTWGFNYQLLFRIPIRNAEKEKVKSLKKN